MPKRNSKKRLLDDEEEDHDDNGVEAGVPSSVNENTSRADSIVRMRIVTETRSQYASTFLMIEEMCVERVPGSTVGGKLLLPMSLESCKGFIGFASKTRANGSVRTESTV